MTTPSCPTCGQSLPEEGRRDPPLPPLEQANVAEELRRYGDSLRTWTLADEEVGNVRPLRDLLNDAADALSPPPPAPLTDEDKATITQSVAGTYDAFARRVGERWPWLHPDYDPTDIFWRARADRAHRDRERRHIRTARDVVDGREGEG